MSRDTSRMGSFLKLCGINGGVLIIFLLALEVISAMVYTTLPEGLVSRRQGPVKTWNFELHPAVGHAHQARDFKISPNAEGSDSSSTLFTRKTYGTGNEVARLLVLGGSTTDPLGVQFSGLNGTWPDQLGRLLAARAPQGRIQITNAAVGAGTSSQEVVRLLATLSEATPEWVVSFNGINELYFADRDLYESNDEIYAPRMLLKALEDRPFNHIPYLDRRYYSCGLLCFTDNSATLRLAQALLASAGSTGIEQPDTRPVTIDPSKQRRWLTAQPITQQTRQRLERAASIWSDNVKAMHGITAARGARYLVVLQPTLGLDGSRAQLLADGRLASDRNSVDALTVDLLERKGYVEQINALYASLRLSCGQLPYCLDLSQDSELTTNLKLYTDPRHLNANGNQRIAKLIAARIRP